jgi:DNA-directed RNA polymerase subunit RPC12/RpoP
MPQRIVCSECSSLLYEGDILKSPQDIVKKFDGKCPNCGRKLVFSTKNLSIYPCDETEDDDSPER